MLEIKEQETLPFEEDNQHPEEVTKYHKRIDDVIEDAEIEAEIEAEKKIRSKNSRMFSISMMGILLLVVVYFQINNKTSVSSIQPAKENSIKRIIAKEKSLASLISVKKDESNTSNFAVSNYVKKTNPIENPFINKSISKITPPSTKKIKVKKTSKENQILKNPKTKTILKELTPVTKNESSMFYIQAGAFGVRKNADSLLKQLKKKGFSPSIQIESKKSKEGLPIKTYKIKLGVFPSREKARLIQEKLAREGFSKTFLR